MTDKRTPPKFENAPGLVVRPTSRRFRAFWQARSDLVERGYEPRTVTIWGGIEPTETERAYVSDRCNTLQSDMLVWGRGGLPTFDSFDGTIRNLIRYYQTDQDSGFQKLRFGSKEHYITLCRRIENDHGNERVENIKVRTLLRWHEEWGAKSGVAMGHALVGMLRTLFSFGAAYLEDDECERLGILLHKMRIPAAKPRTERLTSEQVIAIREAAHLRARPSIALAQAFQFECTFRQKDVVGEWVPLSEPGISEVRNKTEFKKWLRGIRWSEIDQNMILRHVTSKRLKEIEIDLKLAPMVLEELARSYGYDGSRSSLPSTGPIIISEMTGVPYIAMQFRTMWRRIATKAGIPKSVKNMDSRAGAISEATDAGASLEQVRHAATHSNVSTTANYSRGTADKTAEVMRMRLAHRKNKMTDS